MNETPKYLKEVQHILANFHENGNGDQDTDPQALPPPENEIDMYVEEDRITLIPRRLHGIPVNEQDIVDSIVTDLDTTPLPAKPQPEPVSNAMIGVLLLAMLLPLFCIAIQLYFILNPFTVTVTMLAKSQQVSITGTLQLGRELNPITISQSATVNTTGHGHQAAKQAIGYITFYNGQSNQVTVPAGTILTGSSGERIVTDATATIPPANQTIPPTFGQTTVPAHAVEAGSRGNIATGDINQSCCATAIEAINTTSFTGGQDERDFQTVTKSDITNAVAPLQATLKQSVQGILQGQLKTNEALVTSSCTITTTADHQIGQEATQVKVTVSETCSAVAYDEYMLQTKVTDLMSRQATIKLGTGYSILGNPQITINQAASQSSKVVLSFKAQSTWVYALSSTEQQHIKNSIAGKTREKAMQLLASLPGIERIAMHSSGFGDDTNLPKDLSHIHLLIIYAAEGLFASRSS